MSLKDELDVRVRKYQSENPVPSPEEIEDEAKACAARQWKKLRKKFGMMIEEYLETRENLKKVLFNLIEYCKALLFFLYKKINYKKQKFL